MYYDVKPKTDNGHEQQVDYVMLEKPAFEILLRMAAQPARKRDPLFYALLVYVIVDLSLKLGTLIARLLAGGVL